MLLDVRDTVFVSIDIQPRARREWTEANAIPSLLREFGLVDLNAAVAHFHETMLPNAFKVAEWAREMRIPRVFVYWAPNSKAVLDDACAPHGSFHIQAGDLVIPKTEMDAFGSSTFDVDVAKLGRKTLLMVGGHTRGCLGETAKSGFKAGYKCVAVRDATFDVSMTRWPLGLAEVPYASILTTAEVLKLGAL